MFFSDLPVCRASGIGAATNEIYRRDGRRADMHPLEDRSFHFSVDEFGICVYGVFDGFGGSQVNHFTHNNSIIPNYYFKIKSRF